MKTGGKLPNASEHSRALQELAGDLLRMAPGQSLRMPQKRLGWVSNVALLEHVPLTCRWIPGTEDMMVTRENEAPTAIAGPWTWEWETGEGWCGAAVVSENGVERFVVEDRHFDGDYAERRLAAIALARRIVAALNAEPGRARALPDGAENAQDDTK